LSDAQQQSLCEQAAASGTDALCSAAYAPLCMTN
jgi:hypothetical protein